MEKVSNYAVVSDRAYRTEDGVRVHIVFATRTARVVFVLPPVAEALRCKDADAVPPAMLPMLRRAQVIVPGEQDELSAILDRNREATADRGTVQYILLPTSYCNMACSYCGQEHTRGGLTSNHRDRVRARVLRAIGLPSTRAVKIDWFGAEPMAGYAVIRDLASAFVRAAAERGVRYDSTMVTNGSLLNSTNLDVLVRRCGLNQFDITLDGPPEVHDAHRPLKNGRGSFWSIVNVVREAIEHDAYRHVGFDFRTNVDIDNCDAVSRYIDLMAELGFARPNVTFSLARVRPWGNDVSAIELSREEFARREIGWMRTMQEHGLTLHTLPTRAKTVTCPAVRPTTELISGTGNIFSCTDHPLVPDTERTLALAHIGQEDLPVFRPEGQFDHWYDDIEAGKSWCRGCVFLPTCGGACPKSWHEGNPPCPSYKLNIQGRFDLVASSCGLVPAEVQA